VKYHLRLKINGRLIGVWESDNVDDFRPLVVAFVKDQTDRHTPWIAREILDRTHADMMGRYDLFHTYTGMGPDGSVDLSVTESMSPVAIVGPDDLIRAVAKT